MGYGAGIAVSCGVDHRDGSDPAVLWLWQSPGAAAPIQPLAWELPFAMDTALKKPKKKKNRLKANHETVSSLVAKKIIYYENDYYL